MSLADRVRSGEVRAVARACRIVDDRATGYRELLKELYPSTGRAWVLGVTGNPGAGKSTLTDRLIRAFRDEGRRVGVVAVDPTSPFTGGAILGDRIRMQAHFQDPEVFIRSVATRGALGGLSRSATDIVRVLDAWGAGVVLVETVGVGQDELEVTRAAQSTLVVVPPGLGDDIQAIKAGLLECADVFAVNKADRPGAEAAVRDLEVMLSLGSLSLAPAAGGHGAGALRRPERSRDGGWTPPVVRCVATRNEGVEELLRQLHRHRGWLSTEAGRQHRAERLADQLVVYLRDELAAEALRALGPRIQQAARDVEARALDPYTACERLVEAFRAGANA